VDETARNFLQLDLGLGKSGCRERQRGADDETDALEYKAHLRFLHS
jgi:hypothetical protein